MFVLNTILIFTAALILVPVLVFSLECLLSVMLVHWSRSTKPENHQPQVAVLIPAHNEQAVIEQTLQALLPTLSADDRVVVIADNCTDNTALLARALGAEVVERYDDENRGKAFALQAGIQFLSASPPDVVVVLDADCKVENNLVSRISTLAFQTSRPVQGRNLSVAESNTESLHAVSELGFRFKNLVRPLGSARLGFPCHLMGTGMAIPWQLLQKTSLAADHLAEDMQFGIDLAIEGHPTLFCPEVGITSQLPQDKRAFLNQRTRWEQGHLRTSITQTPRLLVHGLLRCRPSLLFLGLDLTVPPLSLLILGWTFALGFMTLTALLGASWVPVVMLLAGGTVMVCATLAGWFTFCRKAVPFKSLMAIPGYIFRKLPIYVSYFTGRKQTEWIRTQRDEEIDFLNPVETSQPEFESPSRGELTNSNGMMTVSGRTQS
ncbi:MAG: glycosyltransferase family 2 protein [Planctomycetaceae bacterium]